MSPPSRRRFLQSASMTAVGAAGLDARTYAQTPGANERIGVGIIGPGTMGRSHLVTLGGQADVRVVHIAEVDQNRLAEALKVAERVRQSPRGDADLRRVLDNRDVQAVFIATPDHWHAPASILALAAGKHVYIEKPMTWSLDEGEEKAPHQGVVALEGDTLAQCAECYFRESEHRFC